MASVDSGNTCEPEVYSPERDLAPRPDPRTLALKNILLAMAVGCKLGYGPFLKYLP